MAWDYPFERIFSFLDYDEMVQKIMHHIKYYGKNKLAWYMGKILSEHLPPDFFDGFDIITAVPLHWKRKLSRGYNQAHWLAGGFVYNREFPKLKENIIKRQRSTKTQTKLDKAQRQKNIHDAFVLNPDYRGRLSGKSVILVDDVVTTGATTSVCTEELLKSGCSRVKVLSLTRD
ncbi:MAG: hypothetical protein Q4F84_04825 [Fibrobacter sp.]|nr:hypothetical protein [Fibrobacter sp.]